uniref:Uncharacterized protein n=1 Tax=Knipowitschia caucasica TaxID=637954 RepID=A0AAV2M964_KNICA
MLAAAWSRTRVDVTRKTRVFSLCASLCIQEKCHPSVTHRGCNEHDDGGDRCGGGRSFGVLNEEDGLPRLVCSSPIDPASGGADGAGGPITNVPPSPSISHSPLSLGDPTRLDCGYATLRWDLGTNHHFFLPSEVMEPGGAGGLLERAAVKSISVFAEFESEP